ncbi:MAG: IS1634 family transposase, partial [Pseudomonadota bacterium]
MSSYEIKHLNHLGLVAGFCNEMGLIDYINEQFPNQVTDKSMSYGHCLQAMILNGLGFTSQTLYLQRDFFKDKPCEKLLGKGIQPEHINDAVLGRSLDKFYEFGVSNLYMGLAEKVIEHLGLDISCHHLDSTSFHLDGDYNDSNPNAIQLVQGYSRDHRPELNQAILNLLVENQAGIPLYMKPA